MTKACATPKCKGKLSQVAIDVDGYDATCDKCTKWKHVDFMHDTGSRLGLSCVDNCPCGYGIGGRNYTKKVTK